MIRCLIGACVLVLAAQSPVRANDDLLELTIWKLDVKEGQLAPTSYKEVKKLVDDKVAKVAYSIAISAQANKIFKLTANQDGGDQTLRLNVDGELSKKEGDKKTTFSLSVIFKTEEKAAKGKLTSFEVTASGDLRPEGQVLSVLQTPQGTLVMTLANAK